MNAYAKALIKEGLIFFVLVTTAGKNIHCS